MDDLFSNQAYSVAENFVLFSLEVGSVLLALEFFFTLIFSAEYFLRVMCLQKPQEYVLSLLGVIDLAALVPTYLGKSHNSDTKHYI